MPRWRKSANDKAAPKSAWGVQRRDDADCVSRRVRAVGPRAATDKSPPQSFAGMRRAVRASALIIASSPLRPGCLNESAREGEAERTVQRDALCLGFDV